jgi:hypothetical protein
MVAAKRKIDQSNSSINKVSKGTSVSIPANSEELKSSMGFWKDELAELEASNFNSVEEAINALIDKVLIKLELDKVDSSETKQFLLELFETDPVLQEEIKNVLKC